MTVTINLVYIIAVWLYALVVTGFWVLAVLGSGKDRQDGIMLQTAMDAENRHFRDKAKKLEEENGKLRAGKRTLAEQYIKIQNEYAYYRTLVRAAFPEEEKAAVEKMAQYREEAKLKLEGKETLHTEKRREKQRKAEDMGGVNDI